MLPVFVAEIKCSIVDAKTSRTLIEIILRKDTHEVHVSGKGTPIYNK